MGSCLILGMALGACTGGIIMQIGRRKTIFICIAIGVTGNLLTANIHSFAMINIGRFLYGYASGVYTAVIPKYYSETLPDHLVESMIAGFIASFASGSLISNLFIFIMPSVDDPEALKQTDNWLIIYVYFPIGLQLITLLCFFTILKYEPIKFLISKDQLDEARLAIQLVYKYAHNEVIADRYIEKIREYSGKASSKLTLKDALFNPAYRRATWVNIGYMVFHELTGINVINMYSY